MQRTGWILAAAYAIHILEEAWLGPGYSAWLAAQGGLALSEGGFLLLNGSACLLLAVLVAGFAGSDWFRFFLLGVSTLFLLNGFAHLADSLLTGTYSPGTASGSLLWLPIGLVNLKRLRARVSPRGYCRCLAVGVLGHLLLSLALWSPLILR